jgi:hypothetical protein
MVKIMFKFPLPPALPRFQRASGLLFIPVVTAFLTGCGNLTAGGLNGVAEVAVSGDVPGTLSPALPVGTGPTLAAANDHDSPEGEVEVEFQLFLERANGKSVPLSDDDIRVRVDLRGRQEADVVNRAVPAVRYTGLRIVFTEIEAEVDSGLVIDGQVVSGAVRVELEDATLTVVKPLALEIEDGERVQLLIDLNASIWLQAVDPDLKRVAEDFFANALDLVVR